MQTDIAKPDETDAILHIHRAAFGQETEADLVRNLLQDPTAQPSLSLIARQEDTLLGHVLFTKISLNTAVDQPRATILCPLAVLPEHQRSGAGTLLIQTGLQRLTASGIDLVFVFGDPAYYGRFGFSEADFNRFPTPHPIPPDYHPGWMVQALSDQPLDDWQGQLICAEALDKAKYWSE